MNGEIRFDTYTLPCVKSTASGNLASGNLSTRSSAQCSVMTSRGGMGVQDGGDFCINTADSLHCATETGTTF